MRFINLEDQYTFDGLWKSDQQKGYIFWFPNEQSTGIIYSMQICMLSDTNENITLSMESNNIFSFPNIVDGVLGEGLFEHNITNWQSIGNKYAYCFNVLCTSKSAGEYICKIKIGDLGYIRVGADFYGEYEPTYINLSNFGVEIPQNVQKAIYTSNVHEDNADHILLNRKFKELMSNYWDIIANKGSYKSLLNSIEWFEYNDNLKIREIWKRNEAGKVVFSDRDIIEIAKNEISQTFINNIKTTYISLYYHNYNELPSYDNEGNPEIEATSYIWSKNDMQIKIALLAKFFGAYFLPIHLSILHATIEDIVFTNTIKTISGGKTNRVDSFSNYTAVECNIKDNDIYKLTNVQTCTLKDTVYKYSDESDESGVKRFGVDVFPKEGLVDQKEFFEQYYGGPGVIIPIHFKIRNLSEGDFIKQTIINYTYYKANWKRISLYDKFDVKQEPINECEICDGAISDEYANIETEARVDIDFNFLATESKEYTFNFTFITASSKTINKQIKFTVEDTDNVSINVYKIIAKDDEPGLTYTQFRDAKNIKYFTTIQSSSNTPKTYTQYLPYDADGIKLNRTVIVKKSDDSTFRINELEELRNSFTNYLEFHRRENDGEGDVFAVIFVANKFGDNIIYNCDLPKYKILRNDMVFYPQFHDLVKLDGNTLEDYTVKQSQALCCAAEINNGKIVIPFRYGKDIEKSEWIFKNISNNTVITHPSSSQKPLIARSDSSNKLDPGYYDIEFSYKLYNNEYSYKLNSAFKVIADS